MIVRGTPLQLRGRRLGGKMPTAYIPANPLTPGCPKDLEQRREKPTKPFI